VLFRSGKKKAIGMAGLAAVLPVILRWLNPKDTAFGLSGK
jgi:hypothetical protein